MEDFLTSVIVQISDPNASADIWIVLIIALTTIICRVIKSITEIIVAYINSKTDHFKFVDQNRTRRKKKHASSDNGQEK